MPENPALRQLSRIIAAEIDTPHEGGAVRAAHDTVTSRCYVDNEGSVWAHVHGAWAYLTDGGEFTTWDRKDELSGMYGPYIELDEAASKAIVAQFAAEGDDR